MTHTHKHRVDDPTCHDASMVGDGQLVAVSSGTLVACGVGAMTLHDIVSRALSIQSATIAGPYATTSRTFVPVASHTFTTDEDGAYLVVVAGRLTADANKALPRMRVTANGVIILDHAYRVNGKTKNLPTQLSAFGILTATAGQNIAVNIEIAEKEGKGTATASDIVLIAERIR